MMKTDLSFSGLAICDRVSCGALFFTNTQPAVAYLPQDVVVLPLSQYLRAGVTRDALCTTVPIIDVSLQIQNVNTLLQVIQDFFVKPLV
jgi:hypothetical protein